jgi:hypothetical protein
MKIIQYVFFIMKKYQMIIVKNVEKKQKFILVVKNVKIVLQMDVLNQNIN